jgi:hypothetical protein
MGLDTHRVLKEPSETWSGENDGFTITPGISIPTSVKKTIRVDGPAKFGDSNFLSSIIEKIE